MNTTIQILRRAPNVRPPERGTPGSVGLDLFAYIQGERGGLTWFIAPGTTRAIPTGLRVNPNGNTILICSRSGLAAKSVFVANAPGIIDPDYRGEIIILLHNSGYTNYPVTDGDRIAQLIVLTLAAPRAIEVEDIPIDTERGDKGFGSTGR